MRTNTRQESSTGGLGRILVTVGPSSLEEDVIRRCAEQNIYLFRVNLSHTRIEDLERTLRSLQSWTAGNICIDSEGAQVRTGDIQGGSVEYSVDDVVSIHRDETPGDRGNLSFRPPGIVNSFRVDDKLNIDFDSVCMQIIEVKSHSIIAKVLVGGLVGSNKAVNLDRLIDLPPVTAKDRVAIQIAKGFGIQHYALSFGNRRSDVELMRSLTGPTSRIITKIESRQGVSNLTGILDCTDEVLIDRGDLSREVPIEQVPFFQRYIIHCAKQQDRPVYVATNLLESMVKSRTPTRAEVNDIVSTLQMGADGLVLAAETAIGKNPVATTEMVRRLITEYSIWSQADSKSYIEKENLRSCQ